MNKLPDKMPSTGEEINIFIRDLYARKATPPQLPKLIEWFLYSVFMIAGMTMCSMLVHVISLWVWGNA